MSGLRAHFLFGAKNGPLGPFSSVFGAKFRARAAVLRREARAADERSLRDEVLRTSFQPANFARVGVLRTGPPASGLYSLRC